MTEDKKQNFTKKFNNKESAFDSELLSLARVTRVTSGGKRLRFRAAMAVGDKKGKVGIGVDKGIDVAQAIEKAKRKAEKNMISFSVSGDTIPHQVQAKFGPSNVLLKPQSKGRGLVAGGVIRILCSLVGIKNISAKIISRSKNKVNNAKATMEAFKKIKDSQEKKVEDNLTKK